MDYTDEHKDPTIWPPGTVRLEALLGKNQDKEIILQPRPSNDPNDPLYVLMDIAIQRPITVFLLEIGQCGGSTGTSL
jgi:hypothetical protein